ncbi:MAG: histone deacetylase [Actinomycetota bacterium]|nr:histone deacetylase [Actinomycetota bacterium]
MGLYVRHPSSFRHETGAHPENARRLAAIEEAMSARDWMGLELVEAPPAERAQLLRVHEAAHLDAIQAHSAGGGAMIDMDTIASEGSWEAALHAAGGAASAAERLLDGEGGFAFCGTRPPGHHADRRQAMGFCLINNVAVAAANAIATGRVERALVFDFDVHHGNGTEAIFYEDPSVLYASVHQSPLYPGTGAAGDVGRGEGEGYTLNMPVPPGTGSDEFLALAQHVVAPVAREFQPQILFLSAGYDAHRDDPLAQCRLDEAAFRDIAASFRELGAELGAPVVVCLEGGYNVVALADSVVATIEGLEGADPPRAAPAAAAEPYLARGAA